MKNRNMFERLAPEMFDLEGVRIVRETDAAVLVETEVGAMKWIPLSQVSKITRVDGGEGYKSSVRMTAWIARQKGFRS